MATGPILVALAVPSFGDDLDALIPLAEAGGATVHLLHLAASDDDVAFARSDLQDRAAQLRRRGLVVEAEVRIGPIVDGVLARADELDASFVAIVGHVHELQHRQVMGSVSITLLVRSERPVMVLPSTARSRSGPDFPTSVDRLVNLLDRIEPEEHPEAVAALREAVERHLEADDEGGDLLAVLRRYEARHPSLARALNDVGYYLSGLGI